MRFVRKGATVAGLAAALTVGPLAATAFAQPAAVSGDGGGFGDGGTAASTATSGTPVPATDENDQPSTATTATAGINATSTAGGGNGGAGGNTILVANAPIQSVTLIGGNGGNGGDGGTAASTATSGTPVPATVGDTRVSTGGDTPPQGGYDIYYQGRVYQWLVTHLGDRMDASAGNASGVWLPTTRAREDAIAGMGSGAGG